MFTLTVTTRIPASAEAVFDYLVDFSNNKEWQSGIDSIEWTSPPPIQVGSTYRQKMTYKGVVTLYEVTALRPGSAITVKSQPGAAIPTTVTRTVQKLDASNCRVSVDVVGELKGLRRITTPLLRRTVRRSIEADYKRLKLQMEAAGDDPPRSP